MKILNNGIAVLENDSHISKWVEEHNSLVHNPSMRNIISPFIKDTDTILEIGAFIGDNTAFLCQLANKGNVVSFEPQKEAFECLSHNFKSIENVSVYNKAVGLDADKLKVVHSPNAGASHLEKGGDIECVTIDSLKLNKLDVIVMDCEGFELDCLIGGYKTINKYKPNIILEINKGTLWRKGLSPLDIFNWLMKQGYTFSNIYPNQKMEGEQYDIICIQR